MKKNIILLAFVSLLITTTSCNRYLKSGMGAETNVMLNRNSDEYTIKRLKTIEMNGRAVFGIPGFGTNNQNKNKTGMVFKFNGIQIGRTPRIAPLLTMIGFTFGYAVLAKSVIKIDNPEKIDILFNDLWGSDYGKLRLPFAALIGIPLAGVTNNLVWDGIALSGLTNQMYYRLVDENPDVDIFTNPKYKIDYKLGLFRQKATIRADVMGAALNLK